MATDTDTAEITYEVTIVEYPSDGQPRIAAGPWIGSPLHLGSRGGRDYPLPRHDDPSHQLTLALMNPSVAHPGWVAAHAELRDSYGFPIGSRRAVAFYGRTVNTELGSYLYFPTNAHTNCAYAVCLRALRSDLDD